MPKSKTSPFAKYDANGHIISRDIKPAFYVNGVQYYQFEFDKIPIVRYDVLGFYLQQFSAGITSEELEALVEGLEAGVKVFLEKPLNGEKVTANDVTAITQIIAHAKSKIKHWEFNPLAYAKVATVLYFDETENPFVYDFKYNLDNKLALFSQNEVITFFLRVNMANLSSMLNVSVELLADYLEVNKQLRAKEIAYLKGVLAATGSLSENLNTILSVMETQLKSIELSDMGTGSITHGL